MAMVTVTHLTATTDTQGIRLVMDTVGMAAGTDPTATAGSVAIVVDTVGLEDMVTTIMGMADTAMVGTVTHMAVMAIATDTVDIGGRTKADDYRSAIFFERVDVLHRHANWAASLREDVK